MPVNNNRFVCIHCHFYQPPRENPWLEAIEHQESAYPFHDWNERISNECYAPNGLSRILDNEGWVTRLANNYSKISFNFGPTLLSWLEEFDQGTYQAILDGDKQSLERYNGHGSAMAQVYNHIIMPLANRRDKETQIIWGLKDFEKRFGRQAESMWLAETAVDTETLEVLAYHGMKFVVLAPRQAKSIKAIQKGSQWADIHNESIDPKQPYLCKLPSGRTIVLFFYDGPISKAVAFEGLLHNGEKFAGRLMSGFGDQPAERPQILHIATDGETYGHHHRHGDMALAYALDYIEESGLANVTNYSKFLAENPPITEAKIHENSSWSCVHGVERWRSDCGCSTGGMPDWHQKWREPLRESFDLLRDRLNRRYINYMKKLGADPWIIRDDYIEVILNRSDENIESFMKKWKIKEKKKGENVKVGMLKALELQRNLLFMYTSCAWFFADISGIEPVQTMKYASRAIELGKELFGLDLTEEFLEKLEHAPSNLPEHENGRKVYEKFVPSSRIDHMKAAAHFAVMSVFCDECEDKFYCFDFKINDSVHSFLGKSQILISHADMISAITKETKKIQYCVIHFGDHNVSLGVSEFTDLQSYEIMCNELTSAFDRGDLTLFIRIMERCFGDNMYSLKELFKDQQKKIVNNILYKTMKTLESKFEDIYRQNYPVMCYLSSLEMHFPSIYRHIAEYVQNRHIKQLFRSDKISVDSVLESIEEAERWNMQIDEFGIRKYCMEAIERLFDICRKNPSDIPALHRFHSLIMSIDKLPFSLELGYLQNEFYIWYHQEKSKSFTSKNSWDKLTSEIAYKLRIRI